MGREDGCVGWWGEEMSSVRVAGRGVSGRQGGVCRGGKEGCVRVAGKGVSGWQGGVSGRQKRVYRDGRHGCVSGMGVYAL